MVVHAFIGGHQLVGVTAAHLHMLAHKAALGRTLVIAAWVCVALHYLLTILTPPAMPNTFYVMDLYQASSPQCDMKQL